MSSQGVSLPDNTPTWLRKLIVPGMVGLMAGIVLQFFKLFDARPEQAIELLKSWGPGSLLGTLALAVIAGLLSQLMDVARDGVAAQRLMADSMGRIADKDDRQIQEIQTLSSFTAQESRGTRQQLGEVAVELRRNSEYVRQLVDKLSERELGKDEQAKGASA